jgi:hypothetical protein
MFFEFKPYPRIPVWENKRRIRFLIIFGNALAAFRQSTNPNERAEIRSFINRNINAAHAIIQLARVSTEVAQFGSRRDLIANVFLELEGFEPHEVFDTIDRAIGVYETDQTSAWLRTFWPFYWIEFFVNWLSRLPFKILGVRNTDGGLAGIIQRLTTFSIWLIGLTASVLGILDFIGKKPMVLNFLGHFGFK